MPENSTNTRHPFASLVYLILLILIGTLFFSLLGLFFGGLIYGFDNLLVSGSKQVGFLEILQTVSSIGTFLIPAWVYAQSENKNPARFLKLDLRTYPILLVLTIAVMFSSSAIMDWTVQWNQQMQLPQFLKDLEIWMRAQEDKMAELTKQLLTMNSSSDLLINLLMVALLPALGEELIFRGCIQQIFTRWTKNYHWGIWIAAIIFSAIHLQFYGFLPRMLLGALFGYLFVWSNSLWIPIMAHFMNNGLAVLMTYIGLKQGKTIESLQQTEQFAPPVYISSLFFTLFILWLFYQYAQQKKASPNS